MDVAGQLLDAGIGGAVGEHGQLFAGCGGLVRADRHTGERVAHQTGHLVPESENVGAFERGFPAPCACSRNSARQHRRPVPANQRLQAARKPTDPTACHSGFHATGQRH